MDILKEPEVTQQVKKEKDPKKVAAGKALARKNAEGRKAVLVKPADPKPMKESSLSFNDVNYGIQTAAGFVGAGFILYHGYKFFSQKPSSPSGARASEPASLEHPSLLARPVRPNPRVEPPKYNGIQMN